MNKGRLITSLLCGLVGLNTMVTAQNRPRLVVGIVVDQLRNDYIEFLQERLGEKGFRHLMNDGVWMKDVDFTVSGLDKGVGTSIAMTGAYPMLSGVNEGGIKSPSDLLLSTIADEIAIDGGGLGYIYSLAPDATTAMILGGHAANSAAWIDTNNGRWTTSGDYKGGLPLPLSNRNHRESPAQRIETLSWRPSDDISNYKGLPEKSLVPFMHTFSRSDRDVFSRYVSTPLVNEEVTDMAIEYLNQYRLGKRGDEIDMLNVGYTLEPYRYAKGDNRIELQDAYLRLDRQLERLLSAIDSNVGLDNALIFLSSTGYFNEQNAGGGEKFGIPGGTLSLKRMMSLLNAYLSAKYGNGNYVESIRGHHLHLNHKTIEEKRLNTADVTAEAREFIVKMSGVGNAYTLQEILAQATPELQRLRLQTNPAKAGDIYIEYMPGWSVSDDTGNGPATTTAVRLSAVNTPAFIFAPALLEAAVIETPVEAVTLAPAVCSVLRIRAPNGAGHPASLREIKYKR